MNFWNFASEISFYSEKKIRFDQLIESRDRFWSGGPLMWVWDESVNEDEGDGFDIFSRRTQP